MAQYDTYPVEVAGVNSPVQLAERVLELVS